MDRSCKRDSHRHMDVVVQDYIRQEIQIVPYIETIKRKLEPLKLSFYFYYFKNM